jgi:hypothetical protein
MCAFLKFAKLLASVSFKLSLSMALFPASAKAIRYAFL